MKFHIFEGTSPDWDYFLLANHHEDFLQSFEWGEFQTRQGKKVVRIVGQENGQEKFLAQGFVHSLGFGMKYLYLPRIQNVNTSIAADFFVFLKQQGFVFARVEPIQKISETFFKKVSTHHRQYQYTSQIDLTQPNEDLLKNFHEKTRYNIRLAAKKGVTVKQEKNIEIFWPLLQETYERDKIKSHTKEYYKGFIALPGCTQLTAYVEEQPIASVLLYIFGKTCVYVHGASSNEHRNLMAPYLLQWESMQYARTQGCTIYDFGGVARPADPTDHNALTFHTSTWDQTDKLSGVTRFKAGFNGTIKHFAEAEDILFQPFKYRFYQLVRKFV